MSLAVANAVLDVIERDDLMLHATKVGSFLMAALDKMKFKYNFVGDVRGQGLFIGIDLVTNPLTKAPATQFAEYVVKRCKDMKIIVSTEGKYGNVIKFKPPMVFTMDDAKTLIKALTACFEDIDAYYHKNSMSTTSSISCDSLPCSDDESSDCTDSSTS